MNIKPGTRVRRAQCATCIFRRPSDGGCELQPGRLEEIQGNLLNGMNQLCHHDDNRTICRGGRDFQLQVWHRLGLIDEPTDAALREAMRGRGFTPGDHV